MATITFKAIRPGRSRIFNYTGAKNEMVRLLNQEARLAQQQFQRTTATWKHKPSFTIVATSTYERRVVTSDQNYSRINFGTRAHLIVPRTAPILKFRVPYSAKSSPGNIGSNSGGPGPNPVVAKEVHHPGTAPRNFDKTIAEMHRFYFMSEVVRLVIGAIQK